MQKVVEGKQDEVVVVPGLKATKIAWDLDPSTHSCLLKCLEDNVDIFAWFSSGLVGIAPSVTEHKLNIVSGSRPVKQKKRHFGPEKDKVIEEQVQELLRARHIRDVQFPTFLSYVVLVPKFPGKWRMCVEFRDLNKSCPNDCYP